jgi:hypothetical protein
VGGRERYLTQNLGATAGSRASAVLARQTRLCELAHTSRPESGACSLRCINSGQPEQRDQGWEPWTTDRIPSCAAPPRDEWHEHRTEPRGYAAGPIVAPVEATTQLPCGFRKMVALSRRKQGFESPRERQEDQ